MYKGGSSHRVRQSVDLEMTPVPARRSVTETVACRGEDEDLPSVSSAVYQSTSKEGYPALFSRLAFRSPDSPDTIYKPKLDELQYPVG